MKFVESNKKDNYQNYPLNSPFEHNNLNAIPVISSSLRKMA